MKKYVVVTIILISLLTVIGIFKFSTNEPNKVPKRIQSSEIYRLEFNLVTDIIWDKTQVIALRDDEVVRIEIESRESSLVTKGDFTQSVLGVKDNKLVICKWKNSVINSPDEFATDVKILNLDLEEVDFTKYFETVQIVNCAKDEFIFSNNFHGSPQQYYRSIKNNKLEKISNYRPKTTTSGSTKTLIEHNGAKLFEINKVNTFTKVAINEELNKAAFIDNQGYIWIYERYYLNQR